MFNKVLGGILLISGISIGAGMLMLSVTTGIYGFRSSLVIFIVCWLVMTFSAFLILEASLWLPKQTSFPSILKHTLTLPTQIVAWVCFVLLLYALLSVYLEGMSELVSTFMIGVFHVHVVHWVIALVLTVLFAALIEVGTKAVDPINRIMIITMLVIFGILVAVLFPHVNMTHLKQPYTHHIWIMLPIVIAAFGYQIIIPSIKDYLGGNINALRITIFVGSLIPLLVYLVWEAVIVGVVPSQGAQSLMTLYSQKADTNVLAQVLALLSHSRGIAIGFRFFAFFAIATSAICVGIAMYDFIADSLQLKDGILGRLFVTMITYVPPFFFATEFPGKFALVFEYAGVFTAILLIFLPVVMVWRGRYSQYTPSEYRVFGGKIALLFPVVITIAVIFIQLFFHY